MNQFGDAPPQAGWEYGAGGRWFDGVNQALKTFIDAKGPGYAKVFKAIVDKLGIMGPKTKILKEMKAQVDVARAAGPKVLWPVAEKETAERFSTYAAEQGFDDVLTVIHTRRLAAKSFSSEGAMVE